MLLPLEEIGCKKQNKMEIKEIKIADLKPAEYNPKTITEKEFKGLKKSLETFGFVDPAIVNKDGTIIGGHMRIKAWQELGNTTAPCIVLDLNKKQEKKLNVLLNSPKISGKYDDLKLAELLEDMKLDLDYLDLNLDELEPLDLSEGTEAKEDDFEPPKEAKYKVEVGDIFQLGEHRLMCGDSTKIEDVEILMDNNKMDTVFTDPPYGMNAVSKSGVLQKKYKTDILGDDNNQVAIDSFDLCQALNIENQIWWGANYYSSALPDAECWLVWNKNNGGSDQTDCELAWTNYRSVVRQFTQSSEKTNRVHPTQKPISLIAWVFNKFDNGLNVLDLFGGSGSTLIACEQLNRKCYMMELDPYYCSAIIERYAKLKGSADSIFKLIGNDKESIEKFAK